MDLRQIKNLMKEFEDSNIHKLEINEDGLTIKLEKADVIATNVSPVYSPVVSHPNQPNYETPNLETKEVKNNNLEIKAPLVGTYYDSPNPDARPYVSLNQQVSKGDTLFIIEAMKVMNEIKSPVAGIIKAINVNDSTMVEFDQVIIEIEEL